MNWETLAGSKFVETLGWTLLHSLWQIALIAFVLFFALRTLRRFSANARYLAAVCALALSLALPVTTFIQSARNIDSKTLQTSNSNQNHEAEIHKNVPQSEDLLIAEKIKPGAAGADEKTVFGSIEKWQTIFNQRFSALLPFVVGLWFCGIGILAVRLAGGVWQLRRFRTAGISAPGDAWRKRFIELCAKLEIKKSVRLLRSDLIQTPIVVGWLKPLILIPAGVFLQISPRELETIIAHELVHIRRWDAPVNFAQSVVEILFFYHPYVWWISRVIRREREFAADETVVNVFGASRLVYANALANLEEIRLLTNQKLPPFATAANGGQLMQRISKILQKNTEIKRSSSAWSALAAFALISAVLLAVFSFNQTSLVNAQKKMNTRKLAVGFVSIPPVDRSANPPKDADATARLLIEKLKSRRIPAIGFLLGASVSDGEKLYPVRAEIARLWRDAGFEIGIGGFKHVWFYNTPFEEYVANTEKNEAVAKRLLAEKNLPLRYFSYPFLNTGKNAAERTRFESWLAARGITPVKYTIDNQEWLYSYAYDVARNDNDVSTMNEIRVAFIQYMVEMFDHYEAYSEELFGRDIAQTMVLTPSRLVADSADDLFGMIEKRGYQFVSMEEALKDEAYQTPESFYGKSGISWFERWQMAQGKRLRDEPKVKAEVEKIWNDSKAKK